MEDMEIVVGRGGDKGDAAFDKDMELVLESDDKEGHSVAEVLLFFIGPLLISGVLVSPSLPRIVAF